MRLHYLPEDQADDNDYDQVPRLPDRVQADASQPHPSQALAQDVDGHGGGELHGYIDGTFTFTVTIENDLNIAHDVRDLAPHRLKLKSQIQVQG